MDAPRGDQVTQVFDDLAGLFLSDAPAATGTDGRESLPRLSRCDEAESPRVVALMPVNLPVLAGPWVEQAAGLLAQEDGPCALLRRRGDVTCVDVIDGERGSGAAEVRHTGAKVEDGSLPETIARLRRQCPTWIVEVKDTDDLTRQACEHIEDVILLTGSDQVAVVAAFGRIKELAQSIPRSSSIGLMIVGSDEATSERAANRIISACRDLFEEPIELIGTVQRITPLSLRPEGRFNTTQMPLDVLDEICAVTASPSTARPESRPQDARDAEPESIPFRSPSRPAEAVRAEPVHVEVPTQRKRGEEQLRAALDLEMDEPRPKVRSATERDEIRHEELASADDLCSLIEGLIPLDVSCPRCADAEFGFDESGRLHVLLEDGAGDTLSDLEVACQWARENDALLARLDPWLAQHRSRQGSERAGDVIAHLFTARVKERRRLADGRLRVHLLLQPGSFDPAKPICVPL